MHLDTHMLVTVSATSGKVHPGLQRTPSANVPSRHVSTQIFSVALVYP